MVKKSEVDSVVASLVMVDAKLAQEVKASFKIADDQTSEGMDLLFNMCKMASDNDIYPDSVGDLIDHDHISEEVIKAIDYWPSWDNVRKDGRYRKYSRNLVKAVFDLIEYIWN